jgi:hypothetical protein
MPTARCIHQVTPSNRTGFYQTSKNLKASCILHLQLNIWFMDTTILNMQKEKYYSTTIQPLPQ